jgi:precorrin-6B methylase 2
MMECGETLLNNHWLGNRGGAPSFLVGTISNVLVMEIGWKDVGSGGYILVSCARSNTSSKLTSSRHDIAEKLVESAFSNKHSLTSSTIMNQTSTQTIL